jgi:riboflavin kinase / FMN adenylyltransferase
MRVWRGHPRTWPDPDGPAAVSIGVFDGVHLGHRALLSHLGREGTPTVLTFDPHPVEVLVPGVHPRLLTTVDERIDLLGTIGIEQVGILDLADIRELAPSRFVEDILVSRVGARQVVVGADFRFGKDRTGDTDDLALLGGRHGFDTIVVDLLDDSDGVISSTRIRSLLEEGRPAEAAAAMGSLFRITGPVRTGDRRGRELGFPTVNLEPPSRKVIPANGIYAGHVVVGAERRPAAISVGVRPTFGDGARLIEAYILDFEGDLYGQVVSVEFAHWLRLEAKFGSVEALVAQMEEDVARTRELTASRNVG